MVRADMGKRADNRGLTPISSDVFKTWSAP